MRFINPTQSSTWTKGVNLRKGTRITVGSKGVLLNGDSQLPTTESNSNLNRKETCWKAS